MEKRIKIWSHRWFSKVGCLVLINSILEAIHVYWASLTWIPKGQAWRDWARRVDKPKGNILIIWRALINTFETVHRGLPWKVGFSAKKFIGQNPWLGSGRDHILPPPLIELLWERGISRLAHIANLANTTIWI